MTAEVAPVSRAYREAFRHEALMYAGDEGFVRGAAAFIREGLAEREPTLAMVSQPKIEMLREELGDQGPGVLFADMRTVGLNPARIIPAWQEFVGGHSGPGRRLRGIGEPIWPERSGPELVESQLHESLLNLAFADAEGMRLLCPYDIEALPQDVIEEAHRSHPFLMVEGVALESPAYRGLHACGCLADPLPEPPPSAGELSFQGAGALHDIRSFVSAQAGRAGLEPGRIKDLALVVDEAATNTILYGGGEGILRAWHEDGALTCEIRDRGQIEQALVGRQRPRPGQVGGNGLWLANQLCELVQVRSSPAGSIVRLQMRQTAA